MFERTIVPKMVIMRGLPGSGKDHYIEKNLNDYYVVSADMFFERLADEQEKTYVDVFDPRRLSEAHADCLREFIFAVAGKYDIAVNNTNSTLWEYNNYIRIATILADDYEVEVIEIPCDKRTTLKQFHARNSHGVPLQTMFFMKERWEDDPRAKYV